MDIYKKNIDFIKKKAPLLYKQFNDKSIYEAIVIEEEPNNLFSISYKSKKCFSNSYSHQKEEFHEMFREIDSNSRVILLLGIGNGEVLNYIGDNFSEIEELYIVEPCLDIFIRFIKVWDIEQLIRGLGKVTFIINTPPKESLNVIMTNLWEKYYKIGFACHVSYFLIFENYINEFKQILLKNIITLRIHYATRHYSNLTWIKNSIYNLKHLEYVEDELRALVKGRPVIIVSAGPSLNKHLQTLKEYRDYIILIAAGSSIKILSEAGIKPHIQVAVDKTDTELIYDKRFYETSSEIPLLYAGTLASTVLNKYQGKKFFMMIKLDYISKYIFEKLNIDYEIIESGSSVVIPTLSFLNMSKCSKIILVGQDMCFYDNELYAKGREKKQNEYDKNLILSMKDIYGNDVNTLRTYLQIKHDYELLINKMDSLPIVNATEGGLGIEGVPNRSLKEVLEEVIKEEIKVFDLENHKTRINEIKLNINYVLEEIQLELSNIKKICNKLIREIDDLKTKRLKGVAHNKLIKQLKQIEIGFVEELKDIGFYKKVVYSLIEIKLMALKNKNDNIHHDIANGEMLYSNILSEIIVICDTIAIWIKDAHLTENQ